MLYHKGTKRIETEWLILRKIDRDNSGNLIDCSYYSILRDEFI